MCQKINILMVSLRSDFGGGPEHMFQLIKKLIENYGFQVSIYIAAPEEEPYWKEFAKIVGINNMLALPHRRFSIYSFIKFCLFIKRKNINIIHSHGKGAGVYTRLSKLLLPKIKVVHTLHGYHVGEYNKLKRYIYTRIEYFFYKLTNAIINVSEGERCLFVKETSVNGDICHVIVNGVEIKNRQDRIKNKNKKICFLARDAYQKNIYESIEIFKELACNMDIKLTLDIYGDIGKNIPFKDACRLDNVFLKGTVPNFSNKLFNYDLFINTSRWEGLPISILEAMSAGVPVLASNVVGNNSIIIDGKNGCLYELGSIEQAVQKIIYIFNDDTFRENIVNQAKNKILDEYSIDSMTNSTYSIYRDILK